MKAGWVYPFIILGGVLQTCGAAMNGQLNQALVNPWLASAVSFALITAFFIGAFALFSTPLPSSQGLDHFGFFHMPVHAVNVWRIAGALLMAGGVGLTAKF